MHGEVDAPHALSLPDAALGDGDAVGTGYGGGVVGIVGEEGAVLVLRSIGRQLVVRPEAQRCILQLVHRGAGWCCLDGGLLVVEQVGGVVFVEARRACLLLVSGECINFTVGHVRFLHQVAPFVLPRVAAEDAYIVGRLRAFLRHAAVGIGTVVGAILGFRQRRLLQVDQRAVGAGGYLAAEHGAGKGYADWLVVGLFAGRGNAVAPVAAGA